MINSDGKSGTDAEGRQNQLANPGNQSFDANGNLPVIIICQHVSADSII